MCRIVKNRQIERVVVIAAAQDFNLRRRAARLIEFGNDDVRFTLKSAVLLAEANKIGNRRAEEIAAGNRTGNKRVAVIIEDDAADRVLSGFEIIRILRAARMAAPRPQKI